MEVFAGIVKNLHFMILQVVKQLEKTSELLDSPSPRLVKAIRDNDDYVDTQKSMIENECFAFLSRGNAREERDVDFIRAINIITSNVERIADFSESIARQMQHLSGTRTLGRFDYNAYLNKLRDGLERIVPSLKGRDSSQAVAICRLEEEIDGTYKLDFAKIIAELRETREVGDPLTVLLILHYLERMGDALLNIGEAILFAIMGERMKIHQYRVLGEAVSADAPLESIEGMELESIWGTRSGVRVGTLENHESPHGHEKVLFKEGNPEKLHQEQESLQRWRDLAPGLAPRVVEFRKNGRGAALLLQYIDGTTMQDVALNAGGRILNAALQRLIFTVETLWNATKHDSPIHASFLAQIQDRLGDVNRLHPFVRNLDVRIGAERIRPLSHLIEEAQDVEAGLSAPFSVFIHGDFNLDNIIYNAETGTLHFVDVHRSRDMDYVQDVSVFLVSSFRIPVFDLKIRRQLETVALTFLSFARRFAREHDDDAFEARLALALVRSFVTSMRFELNQSFAADMHHRAVLLLNRLLSHNGKSWSGYRVPSDILRH